MCQRAILPLFMLFVFGYFNIWVVLYSWRACAAKVTVVVLCVCVCVFVCLSVCLFIVLYHHAHLDPEI